MLPLSEITIPFKASRDALRVSVLVHGFALYLIGHSTLPLWIMMIMMMMLLLSFMYHGFYYRVPQNPYQALSYREGKWWLRTRENETTYTQMRVRFDGGFFMVLWLVGEKKRQGMVLFYDQLSTSQQRFLWLLHTVHNKPK